MSTAGFDAEVSCWTRGDVNFLHAKIDRAHEVTGYKAEIGFEDGLERYVHYFMEKHKHFSSLLEEDIENWSLPKIDPS